MHHIDMRSLAHETALKQLLRQRLNTQLGLQPARFIPVQPSLNSGQGSPAMQTYVDPRKDARVPPAVAAMHGGVRTNPSLDGRVPSAPLGASQRKESRANPFIDERVPLSSVIARNGDGVYPNPSLYARVPSASARREQSGGRYANPFIDERVSLSSVIARNGDGVYPNPSLYARVPSASARREQSGGKYANPFIDERVTPRLATPEQERETQIASATPDSPARSDRAVEGGGYLVDTLAGVTKFVSDVVEGQLGAEEFSKYVQRVAKVTDTGEIVYHLYQGNTDQAKDVAYGYAGGKAGYETMSRLTNRLPVRHPAFRALSGLLGAAIGSVFGDDSINFIEEIISNVSQDHVFEIEDKHRILHFVIDKDGKRTGVFGINPAVVRDLVGDEIAEILSNNSRYVDAFSSGYTDGTARRAQIAFENGGFFDETNQKDFYKRNFYNTPEDTSFANEIFLSYAVSEIDFITSPVSQWDGTFLLPSEHDLQQARNDLLKVALAYKYGQEIGTYAGRVYTNQNLLNDALEAYELARPHTSSYKD